MITELTAIISAIIAIVSLIISIKVYRRDTPKLYIEIRDAEFDCFFCDAIPNTDHSAMKQRVSGVKVLLRNTSSADIEVQSAAIKIKKELFRYIPNDIPFWEDIAFVSSSENNRDVDPNFTLPYQDFGMHFPCIVKGFSASEGYILFFNFPADIKEKVRAQIILRTAVGTIKKNTVLREYNHTFERQEWKDVEQHFRSMEKKD